MSTQHLVWLLKNYFTTNMNTSWDQLRSFLRGKKDGYNLFQCKVGNDPEENERCVRACAEVLDSGDILMVDSNTGEMLYLSIIILSWVISEVLHPDLRPLFFSVD